MHDETGTLTKDYSIAKELYNALTKAHIDAFFSDISLLSAARADYKQKIDEELDMASILIVVATSVQYVNSNWVRYEWDSFYNDILSEKKKGVLLSLTDGVDIRDFPRTLRQTQSFQYAENGIIKTITFINNYFNQLQQGRNNRTTTHGSSYDYNLGNERERLKIQAIEESKNDHANIHAILKKINVPIYNVLDFGCSMGETTRRVFLPFGNKINLVGIDKFQNCVDEFNALNTDYHSICANIDNDNFSDLIAKEMQKRGINGFHLIYCALSLHHTANTLSALKKLYDILLPGGYIYVRTCDDGLKIGYPDPDNIIQQLIAKTSSINGISDRFHGRKLYGMLKNAHFVDIKSLPLMINTADKDVVDRYALFSNTFLWRKNYFKKALDAITRNGDDSMIDSAMQEYNWCIDKTNKIEEMFCDFNFYYEYYVTIMIARKKSILRN